MTQLAHLATLKRRATSLPGLQTYRRELYATTDALTEPGAYALQAALILDAIIDHIAHDCPQQPLERSHTAEQASIAPEEVRTGKRATEAHTA